MAAAYAAKRPTLPSRRPTVWLHPSCSEWSGAKCSMPHELHNDTAKLSASLLRVEALALYSELQVKLWLQYTRFSKNFIFFGEILVKKSHVTSKHIKKSCYANRRIKTAWP
jgi:hypothetical protein